MNDELRQPSCELLDDAMRDLHGISIPDPPAVERLLERLPIENRRVDSVVTNQQILRRTTALRHRGLRVTTAVLLVIALLGWVFAGLPRGNALAQTIAATAEHDVARCKFSTSAWIENLGPASSEEILFFDLKSPRLRIERNEKTLNGTVSSNWTVVQDNQRDRVLVTSDLALIELDEAALDERQRTTVQEVKKSGQLGKKANLFQISNKRLAPFTNAKTDKTLLQMLQEFQDHKKVVVLQETLNGRSAMKYRLEESERTSTLWVDTETKLPLKIEEERPQVSATAKDYKWVLSDFEWDMDAKRDQLFSLKPLDGHVFEDHTNDRENN